MLIRLAHWGWCICFVKIKESSSEISRIIEVMPSLESSWLYSLWHQSGCPTLPLLRLPTDLSNTKKRQRSRPQATGLSALFRRDGAGRDRQGSPDPSQDGLSLVCQSCRVTPSKLDTD